MTRQIATTAAAAIELYRPTKFTELEWAVASSSVRAAVARSCPTSVGTARKRLGALSAFLLWTAGWDRTQAPDLAQLVTVDTIATAADDSGWGAEGTRRGHARELLRVAEALGTAEVDAPKYGAICLSAPPGESRRFVRLEVAAKQDDAATVSAAIATYQPERVSTHDWLLAATPARNLVSSARPVTGKSARQLLGVLAAFLSSVPEWDRCTVPNLGELLTLDNITSHLGAKKFNKTKTRDKHRTQLLLLARTAGTVPVSEILPGTPRAVDVVLAAGAVRPIPVTVLAGVKRARGTSKSATLEHLAQAIAHARDAAAAEAQVSSVVSLSTLVTGLTSVRADTSVAEEADVVHDDSSTRASGASRPPRKRSRRAAGAAAMAAHQHSIEAEADKADGGASRLPHAGEVDPAIREAVEKFLPQTRYPDRRAAWQTNRELATRLVYAHKPTSPRNATNVASYLAAYLAWASRHNGRDLQVPLSVDALLRAEHIELFLDALAWDDESKRSARSLLRRIGTNLRPHGSPTKFKAAPPGAPYSPAERLEFIRLAQHQPTPLQQRRLAFIVGLGLGAGIDSLDFRHLAAGHVERTALAGRSVLLVHVPGRGARARTVAVSDELAPMVLRALEDHYASGLSDTDLVVATCPDAINIASPTTRRIRSADNTKYRVTTARLRNTWLVAAMCAPISMVDLMQFAGIRSAGTLTGLLEYCPPTSAAHVAKIHDELAAITRADQ